MAYIFVLIFPTTLKYFVPVNSEVAAEQEADLFMGDLIRKQMSVYVKAMLNHALDMTFLQATKQKNGTDITAVLCCL